MQNQIIHYKRTIPALLIALVLGCFGLSPSVQAAGRPSIVGLWNVQYFQGTQFLFQTYDQWHSDGLEFEVNSIAPGAVCQGTFKQSAAIGTVHLFHVIFTFDASGVLNGHIDETQTNTVSSDGNTYSGTNDQKFYDLNGNLLFEATGTQTATRLTVER
jgi:hypothetical protein